jgi:hypothetical protein
MLSLRNQILKGRYIVRLSFEEKASFGWSVLSLTGDASQDSCGYEMSNGLYDLNAGYNK